MTASRFGTLVVATIAGVVPCTGADAGRSPSGEICLAPMPHEASSLDRETGNQRGYVSYVFSARVDRGEWLPIPSDSPRLVQGFALDSKHLLAIREGARQVESFWFTFSARGGPRLCLSYTPWYQTWLLEPPMNRPWCNCQ